MEQDKAVVIAANAVIITAICYCYYTDYDSFYHKFSISFLHFLLNVPGKAQILSLPGEKSRE